MQVTPQNRQIWIDFFRAAEVYRDLRPWEWMYDSDLFGVQDPVTGKINYCCILGNLGEHFALNVYAGDDGLNSYYEMLEFGEDDPMMAGLRQKCFSVSFENREDLSNQDRKLIKDLGLKYRGAGQWVMAREYAPGWLPWYISEEAIPFLTQAFEQAVLVAKRAEQNPDLLHFDEEKVLVRVPKPSKTGLVWEDRILEMPNIKVSIALKPDATLMQQAKQISQSDQSFLLNLTFAPSPTVKDPGSRPFFPMIAMLMDREKGLILSYEMFSPDELETNLQEWLVYVFGHLIKCRPNHLILSNGYGAGLLEDIAEELDIELYISPDDPIFRDVMEMMFRFT